MGNYRGLSLAVFPYQRRFRVPLKTRYGQWSIRQGAILALVQTPDAAEAGAKLKSLLQETLISGLRAGKMPALRSSDAENFYPWAEAIGWGEIAPLPEFGTETLAAALAFCAGLGGWFNPQTVGEIPDQLPCCQFAFESAVAMLPGPIPPASPPRPLPSPGTIAALLPSGEIAPRGLGQSALGAWPDLWQLGHRTFKLKIALGPVEGNDRAPREQEQRERDQLDRLLGQLPSEARIRLDANGGLDRAAAERWLAWGEGHPGRLEFIEQPCPPADLETMVELGQRFATPIALDESVRSLADLRAIWTAGWRGPVVVKPAIAGSPAQWATWAAGRGVNFVFSSVFETAIGRSAALAVGARLEGWGGWCKPAGGKSPSMPWLPRRALGFGTEAWLEPVVIESGV